MKLYAVRWPDGSFSVAIAKNQLDAIEEFDRIADTNGLEIKAFDEFLATFKLNEDGQIALEEIDSDTRSDPVHFWAFPIWAEALEENDIREATKKEIARGVRIAKKTPLDPRVRALSHELRMHPDLVERIAESVNKEDALPDEDDGNPEKDPA